MSETRYTLEDLVGVMDQLRNPDGGCPWDLEQDFNTIAPYTIEEAYEVADAVQRGDLNDLKDELGDLLFQVIFHSRLAAEQKAFTMDDVVHHVTAKMISRHPHVFGDEKASSADDVMPIWEARKAAEKAAKQTRTDVSILDDVTLALPALLRAQKLQHKAAKVGFEWSDITGVLDKLQEEISELKQAIESNSSSEISEELGDVMFVLVNFGRKLNVDCESALRGTNDKFYRRFSGMEKRARAEGRNLADLDLNAQDTLWNLEKAAEKNKAA